MKPCRKVGLDVTWRCNWRCAHCFYLRDPRFHSGMDVPMAEIRDKLDRAQAGGLDQAVLVGYGEPTLCRNLIEIVLECRRRGMATSMITNGAGPMRVYENCRELDMDHLHFSTHGVGQTLTAVCGDERAHEKQLALKHYMRTVDWPWRTNMAVQQLNYTEIADVVRQEIDMGCQHFVFLGFLPHYEWHESPDRIREVAVHPAELRPHIEEAAGLLDEAGVMFTIRYHPLCHLGARWWPHVTNARHVFFDPWEWNYELQVTDEAALWEASKRCGRAVACETPCGDCSAYRHCGGWNRWHAAAFDGADLSPIEESPEEYEGVWSLEGGLHDLNPANAHTGLLSEAAVCA